MDDKLVTLEMLRKLYGTEAIIVHHVRHGYKDPHNHITLECLANIEENGLPRLSVGINVLHLGSDLVRTFETGEAAAKWVKNNGGNIEREVARSSYLGSDLVFSMFNEKVMNAIKNGGMKNYEALKNYNPDGLIWWEEQLRTTVNSIFNHLRPGDNCLVSSHSPTVEALFNIFSEEKDDQIFFKELEGFFLVKLADGKIIAHR